MRDYDAIIQHFYIPFKRKSAISFCGYALSEFSSFIHSSTSSEGPFMLMLPLLLMSVGFVRNVTTSIGGLNSDLAHQHLIDFLFPQIQKLYLMNDMVLF